MACQQHQREELLCCNFECDYDYEHEQLPSSSRPSCGTASRSIGHITEDQEKERESPLPSFKVKVKEKPRRSVSFQYSSTLFCYYIPEDEPQEWYTAEDEEIFKAEAQKEVDVLRGMKSASGQSDSYTQTQHHQNMCISLEQQLISPEFSKKRERRKKLVKDAVLREQSKIDTGHGNSSNKVKRIAEAARRYSERSVINAKAFGDSQYIQSKEDNR